MIHVLHTTPMLGPRAYGPSPVVLNLVREQAEHGMDPRVWCLEADQAAVSALDGTVRAFPSRGPRALHYSPEMERAAVDGRHGTFDLLHQHGVFLGLSRVAMRWRSASGGPTVITPHGCLSPVALRISAWKKRLARIAYENRNLAQASCIQALSENEIVHIRNFGLRNPIAAVANGVDQDWLNSRGDAEAFRSKSGIPGDRRILLYLSRIHPIKGLRLLVEALAKIGRRHPAWLLVVAGADECGYEREVRAAMIQLGVGDRVRFVGPQWGRDKRNAFAAAELFVLPSLSEAGSLVVLEALAAAVPVICTEAVSLAGFESARCGWRTAVSDDGLALALEEALECPAERLIEIGARGRCLVETTYTWTLVAQRLSQVYAWLLGQAPKPEHVLLD
jgi:poly(glycerol-phosphate) alpha-glucosyltransferase